MVFREDHSNCGPDTSIYRKQDVTPELSVLVRILPSSITPSLTNITGLVANWDKSPDVLYPCVHQMPPKA